MRRCIGAAFAEMEMRIALLAIAQRVDLQPARPQAERVMRRAITFTPNRGGEVVVGNRPVAAGVPDEPWAVSSH